jgi:hypothetical protein
MDPRPLGKRLLLLAVVVGPLAVLTLLIVLIWLAIASKAGGG